MEGRKNSSQARQINVLMILSAAGISSLFKIYIDIHRNDMVIYCIMHVGWIGATGFTRKIMSQPYRGTSMIEHEKEPGVEL